MPAGILEAPAAGSAPATDTNIDAPLKSPPTPSTPLQQDRMARLMKHVKDAPASPAEPPPDKAKLDTEKEAKVALPKKEAPAAAAETAEDNRPGKLEVEGADKTKDDAKPIADKTEGQKDWKLLQGYKSENATLKKQIAELKKARPAADDQEKKDMAEQLATHHKELEAVRKEKKEIDDLLRFRDYQNHPDFQRDNVAPWEAAKAKAAANLKGLKLTDESGTEREITQADILAFSEMDISAARDAIKKLVPDTADAAEVRIHVDSIRDLTSKYKTALETAWAGSDKWQKEKDAKEREAQETNSRRFKTVQEENSALFKKFDEEHRSTVEHLQEKDGDDEWNTALEKATANAKAALGGNPNNPELSSDDRAKMIKRNTKFINWAIAAPMLHLENTRLKAERAKDKKIIASYQGSEPVPGNGKGKTVALIPADPSAAREQRLQKYVGL